MGSRRGASDSAKETDRTKEREIRSVRALSRPGVSGFRHTADFGGFPWLRAR